MHAALLWGDPQMKWFGRHKQGLGYKALRVNTRYLCFICLLMGLSYLLF